MQVFWDVTLCRWVSSSRRFEGTVVPLFHDQAVILRLLYPEGEDITIVRKFGN
jgi:hypothetical protein